LSAWYLQPSNGCWRARRTPRSDCLCGDEMVASLLRAHHGYSRTLWLRQLSYRNSRTVAHVRLSSSSRTSLGDDPESGHVDVNKPSALEGYVGFLPGFRRMWNLLSSRLYHLGALNISSTLALFLLSDILAKAIDMVDYRESTPLTVRTTWIANKKQQ
jgi:hypothetical protein